MADREQRSQELDEIRTSLERAEAAPTDVGSGGTAISGCKESSQVDCRRWRNRERCWQATAAAMTLLALAVSWHAWQDQPQIVERIRYLPTPVAVDELPDDPFIAAHALGLNRDHYLRQRYVALTVGLDELDGPTSFGRFDEFDNRTYRDLMDQYFESQ